MSKYNYLGTTDAFNECGCCGKQGLKKVAVLEDVDSGAVAYFGTTCAANAAGWSSDEYKAVKKSLRTKRRAEAVKLQKRGLMQKLLTGEWRVNLEGVE